MHIYYDPKDETHVTGVAYLGPSVTPYIGFNPGYRIYTLDGDYANSSWVSVSNSSSSSFLSNSRRAMRTSVLAAIL